MDEQTIPAGSEVMARLDGHPALKARIMRILDVAENTGGDLKRADDAEQRTIDELRMLGQELLQDWGQRLADDETGKLKRNGGVVHQVKKTALA
jgi:hypothetical protein